jgi:hypothetical protein
MNTDTPQKTWTLRFTDDDAVVEGIPQDRMATVLWKAMHGYGSLEQLATEAGTTPVAEREHLIAA